MMALKVQAAPSSGHYTVLYVVYVLHHTVGCLRALRKQSVVHVVTITLATVPVVVQGVVRHGQQLVGLSQAVPGPVVARVESHCVAVRVCSRARRQAWEGGAAGVAG
jgi:hypothetical protein